MKIHCYYKTSNSAAANLQKGPYNSPEQPQPEV